MLESNVYPKRAAATGVVVLAGVVDVVLAGVVDVVVLAGAVEPVEPVEPDEPDDPPPHAVKATLILTASVCFI